MTVGERIAARRKELNMTQDELARKLGYKSRSSINKIEMEWANVPLSKLERVAAALECEAAYLMGWDEEPAPEPIPFAPNMYVTDEEQKLVLAWRQATFEIKEKIAFALRSYGMPRPKGESQETLSTSAGEK